MSGDLTTAHVREAVEAYWVGLEGFDKWLESVKQEAYYEGLDVTY